MSFNSIYVSNSHFPGRWLVVLMLLAAESCAPQEDPYQVRFRSRPAAMQSQFVKTIQMSINGQQIGEQCVVVEREREMVVAGEYEEVVPGHRQPLGLVIIAFRPSKSPESEWLTTDNTQEINGPLINKFHFKRKMTAPAGDYDLRIYANSISVVTGMPTVEFVLKGSMKVVSPALPAGSDR